MIQFKSLFVKNFMSVGNKPVGYEFSENEVYLVTGENGSGKSCILLDGLNYALYGRPFRSINNGQVINSINMRDCLVVVEFDVGKHSYKVERGLKPKIYNLYIDGEKQPNEHGRDNDKFLRENILNMEENTFRQIVILGSRAYTPFMQTTPSHRRVVVENLLNLSIFTAMAKTTREKLNTLMSEAKTLETEMNSIDIVINETQSMVDRLRDSDDNYIQKKREKITSIEKEIDNVNEKIIEETNRLQKYDSESEIQENIRVNTNLWHDARDEVSDRIRRIKDLEKNITFYQENDNCPTCDHHFTDKKRAKVKKECESKIKEFETELEDLKEISDNFTKLLEEKKKDLSLVKEISSNITNLENDVENRQKMIDYLIDDIKSHSNKSTGDLSDLEKKLADNLKTKSEIKKKSSFVVKEGAQIGYIYNLVKDGGIKNRIIAQYLPLINKLMRQYLDIMGSDIDFCFDDNFKETIKSRYRDKFTYASFSEGQKVRIDLALLFTWREISRMRNSASTNLIIFDEIGDSSLDEEGFESFMKVIDKDKSKQCVILITHSPEKIFASCNRIYSWEMKKSFTHLKSLEYNDVETSLTE